MAGAAAVSDDTGLEADALDGAPGVFSARYAGEHATYQDNVDKLLAELERVGAVTPEQRRARFRTAVMVVWPDGQELLVEGVVEGWISLEPSGAGGFGYDPVFVPAGATARRSPRWVTRNTRSPTVGEPFGRWRQPSRTASTD